MTVPPSLSILIPTLDETDSLEETVRALLSNPSAHVREVILIVCQKTTAATLQVCGGLRAKYGERVRIIKQSLPSLGGAFRSGIGAANGSHTLLMFADLESDPRVVPVMVAEAEANPGSVISASRWIRKGGFVRYGCIKLVLNYCFQRLCGAVLNSRVTDFTYGFRLYPSAILKNTEWRETDHAFVLETILGPLLDHVPVYEVPALWSPRRDGTRRSRFRQYLHYIPTLLRIAIFHPR